VKFQLTWQCPLVAKEFCMVLFNTSAGAQTVVATVPARNDARKWAGIPSGRNSADKIWALAAEYLFMSILRICH
jgi:hypothetical protein